MGSDARKVLEIISEETRFEIIKLLVSSTRYLTVNEISDKLSKDKKTIDKHLRILLENGLVDRKYLEDERAYGYAPTKFCSYLIISIEKIFASQQASLEFIEEQKSEVKIKKYSRLRIYLPFFALLAIASLIFIAARLNPLPRESAIAAVTFIVMLILFAFLYLYYTLRKNVK